MAKKTSSTAKKKKAVSSKKVNKKTIKKKVSKKVSKKGTLKKEKKTVANKNSKNNNIFVLIAVLVIAIIVAIVAMNISKSQKVESVNTIEELDDKTGIRFKNPEDGESITYSVEKGNIARMDYLKKTSDGNKKMDYTLRSSSDEQENNLNLPKEWGTKIEMNVRCGDGSEVLVESYVATDKSNIMKASWFDNDKYYLMTTSNLVTREDFLQEVNRVIIANHVSF